MEVIPAIDLSDGKCVRLYKGRKGTEKVYFDDPLEAIDFWIEKGAKRLHFVDLDGAWGSSKNKDLLIKMIQKASGQVKIQVGGGIRTIDAAIKLVEDGVDRVIIGTLAVKNPEKIKILAEKIGSERIIIALDYKDDKIATHGWTEQTNKDPFLFGKEVEKLGAGFILFSSVEADGAFIGPDLKNIEKMVKSVKIPVYAAGGVRNEEDLIQLQKVGTHGVIVGKAFYENKLSFSVVRN